MSLLEVQELGVRYGLLDAVRGVDLTVEAGSVTVVLGANGAGKSSTLRAIVGLAPKSAGQVRFDGADITDRATEQIVRSGLTLVPEGRRVFAPLTVEENLLLGSFLERSGGRRSAVLRQVYDLFPVLYDRRNGRSGLLSGGEQQMLAFGRALMCSPRLIMMDEPSMGLAPIVTESVMTSVSDIAATGIGVLMVEQNAAVALEIADHAVVFERGQVALHGPAKELATSSELVRAFLGHDAEQQLS